MSKFKIEIQITLLSVFIGVVVVASGYFAYQSLSEIVTLIHREAVPNNRLFIIKNLAADLATLENNARLYILTDESEDLQPYNETRQKINSTLETLQNLPTESMEETLFSDSVCSLANSKTQLWQQILILHQSAKGIDPGFTEIYSKLDEVKLDTIKTETPKKGFFRKIFGTKKVDVDTTIVERTPDKEEILQEIQTLENEIKLKGDEINTLESQLIEKNLVLVQKINKLIAEADQKENNKLLSKTGEADRLAEITYQRLKAFSIAAVLLLLLALFVLFNYQRKSRKYQLALKKAKLQAEDLAAAKEKFAANVTHELRTPVNAIFGLTEQLHQMSLDKNAKEMVSVLSKSATHLKSVVNDTLDFTKMQSGKLKLENTDFSPAEVFNEIVTIQKPEAQKRNNNLVFEWLGEKPEALLGDPMRLKQILINLIGNAIKFTQNGEIKLEVSCKTVINRYHFYIAVSDSGVGISKENLKIIFDEYVQAENTKGVKNEGTGLGLSIVKKLVDLHKGKIQIESEPGKGTTIKVEIAYPPGNPENISKTKPEKTEVPEYLKQLTYLIADDTDYNRFTIKGLLKNWGARYLEATNGKEAVDLAIQNSPDIVLMDLRMPEKNGIEAAMEILNKKPGTTIIAVSASGEEKDLKTSLNAGMAGFLLKPFSENELIETLISKKKEILLPPKNQKLKINPEEMKRLANGDEAFFKEMIQLFITSGEKGLQTIEEALQNKNTGTIRETAHKLAAPCKHLQAENLYQNIKSLEKLALEKSEPKKLEPVFRLVKSELEEIIVLLKNYLGEMPNK